MKHEVSSFLPQPLYQNPHEITGLRHFSFVTLPACILRKRNAKKDPSESSQTILTYDGIFYTKITGQVRKVYCMDIISTTFSSKSDST